MAADRYEPPFDFLRMVASGDVPLAGSFLADRNLARLLALTRDADDANHDWATFLLAQSDLDTPVVRAALMTAASDGVTAVRDEALLGMAARDRELALPLIRTALAGARATAMLFEAAEMYADASLLHLLAGWTAPSAATRADEAAARALAACERLAREDDVPSSA